MGEVSTPGPQRCQSAGKVQVIDHSSNEWVCVDFFFKMGAYSNSQCK